MEYYLPILLEACGEEFVFIYRQLQRMIFQEVRLEIVKTVFLRESIPDKIFFLLRIWYSLNVCVCVLTEAGDTKKRWQEYTEELYKRDLHDPYIITMV